MKKQKKKRNMTVLSSGQSFFLAVVCMTDVRNDWGLKSPEIHVLFGSPMSPVQSASCVEVSGFRVAISGFM